MINFCLKNFIWWCYCHIEWSIVNLLFPTLPYKSYKKKKKKGSLLVLTLFKLSSRTFPRSVLCRFWFIKYWLNYKRLPNILYNIILQSRIETILCNWRRCPESNNTFQFSSPKESHIQRKLRNSFQEKARIFIAVCLSVNRFIFNSMDIYLNS